MLDVAADADTVGAVEPGKTGNSRVTSYVTSVIAPVIAPVTTAVTEIEIVTTAEAETDGPAHQRRRGPRADGATGPRTAVLWGRLSLAMRRCTYR